MEATRYCIAVIVLINARILSAYDDKDLRCSNAEHISEISRKIEGAKKTISSKCSAYSTPISDDVACFPGIAFKCTDTWEGCDDPSAWIAGFLVFDVDPNAEIYVPLCCVSSNGVKIDQSKCKDVKLVERRKQNFRHTLPSGRLFTRFRCKYFKSGDQKPVDYMTMAVQECAYNATTISPTSSTTSRTTTTVDPSLCFTRFISKNQPIDYVEDHLQVIDMAPATTEKECAGHCLRAESTHGAKCRSYRFVVDPISPTCALRANHVHDDKANFLEHPVNVAYGNLTAACDSVRL